VRFPNPPHLSLITPSASRHLNPETLNPDLNCREKEIVAAGVATHPKTVTLTSELEREREGTCVREEGQHGVTTGGTHQSLLLLYFVPPLCLGLPPSSSGDRHFGSHPPTSATMNSFLHCTPSLPLISPKATHFALSYEKSNF